MRVTPQMMMLRAIENSRRHTNSMADLQLQAATGLRINKLSDDPAAVQSLLEQKLVRGRFEAQLGAVQTSRTRLNGSVAQLLDAADVITQAKDAALEADPSARRDLLAEEVNQLFDRLVAIANSSSGGEFYFGGAATDRAPIASNGRDQTAVDFRARYVGADIRGSVSIGDLSIDVSYTAREVFFARDRGPTLFRGATGAAPGAGVDSGIGQSELTVRHTATSYAAGSGIAPGSSSADGDTILGPTGAHRLTISGGAVSLNGGRAVAFDGTETDLQLVGPEGETVYVNTTSVAPAFSGDVDITADGTLSLDGGESEIAIDFSATQAVVNSDSGEVTHVDSRVVRFVGVERIEYPGTVDAFHALISLRDTLLNGDNLPTDEVNDALQRRIGDLERIHSRLLSVVGEQSTTLENLDAIQLRTEDQNLETQKIIGELESADLADVAVRLQSEQTLLQFTWMSSVSLMNQSILDFLG